MGAATFCIGGSKACVLFLIRMNHYIWFEINILLADMKNKS